MSRPPSFPADAQPPYYSSKKEIHLQGPRPSPLKISNESHKIKKPPPPTPQRHPAPPEPDQQQQPSVRIYTILPPKVTKAKSPDEFRDIVQRLTGLQCDGETPSRPGDVSPAARLALIEKTSPTEKEKTIQSTRNDDITTGMLEKGVEVGQFPGVLTQEPSTLPPPIYPEIYSPPVSNQETVSHYNNELSSAYTFVEGTAGFPSMYVVNNPRYFKDIVQLLTGQQCDGEIPSTPGDLSPAAGLASKEKATQSTRNDDITTGMLEQGVEVGQFSGVLSPPLPIYPEIYLPPVLNTQTVSHYNNEFWSANNFMAAPSGFPSLPLVSTVPSLYREPCMNNSSILDHFLDDWVKHDWTREIDVKKYDDQSVKIMLEHEKHHCFVSFRELDDITSGEKWLELCHLAIWCTYLYRLCAQRGIDNLYGFVCPYKLSLKGFYSPKAISSYIIEKLASNKEVYLAPFCHSNHWQLIVILPQKNTVVWMCSLGGKPTKQIKDMINIAMKGYFPLDTKWLYPKMPRQENNYHCGYFVMKFMLTIINAGIIDNWEKMVSKLGILSVNLSHTEVFYDLKSYTSTEIFEVSQLWLEFYSTILGEHISPKHSKKLDLVV